MVKSSDKLVPKKPVEKWDCGKFWTENCDCPSKSGTVGARWSDLIQSVAHTISMVHWHSHAALVIRAVELEPVMCCGGHQCRTGGGCGFGDN